MARTAARRQPPTIRPSHQRVGPALPLVSNTRALYGPRYQSRSNQPIVVGSSGGRSAAPPTARLGRPDPGRRAAGTRYPGCPSRSTSTACRSASALRTAVRVDPSHHLMSVTLPGPKTRSHRSTNPATPCAAPRCGSRTRATAPLLPSGVARWSTRLRSMLARRDPARTERSTLAAPPAPAHPRIGPCRRPSTPPARDLPRATPRTWTRARRRASKAPAHRPLTASAHRRNAGQPPRRHR